MPKKPRIVGVLATTARRADSRRLDAMIEFGLSVNIPVVPFGGGAATRGIFQGDDGPIAEAVDARDAIDLAILELTKRRIRELS